MDRIVLEGFPRSGNAFLSQLIKLAFPKNEIIMFQHKMENLDKKNCIVPIRNPYESIPSWVEFSPNKPDFESVAKWYIRFYNKVLENIDNLVIVDFVELTTDTSKTLNKISDVYKINAEPVDISKLNKNENLKLYSSKQITKYTKEAYQIYKEVLKYT